MLVSPTRGRLLAMLATCTLGASALVTPTSALAAERFEVGASAGYEYDDNVNAAVVDLNASGGDSAGTFDAFARADLVDTDTTQVEARYDFYVSDRAKFNDFDLRLHLPSLTVKHQTGDEESGVTDWELGYSYTHTTLGHDKLYDAHSIAPSVGRLVGESFYATVSAAYEHRNFVTWHPISAGPPSDRTANLYGGGSDVIYLLPQNLGHARASYAFRVQDANRDSFDYVSNTVEVGLLFNVAALALPLVGEAPAGPGTVAVAYKYDRRNYEHRRDDRRHESRVSVTAPLGSHLTARGEFLRFDSESSLPAADYVSNVVTFGLGVAF